MRVYPLSKIMLILPVLCSCLFTVYADVTISTTHGTIEGFTDTNNGYIAFRGIPYVGHLTPDFRFKEAPPLKKLPDNFKANQNDNIVCAHFTPSGIEGQEDCLTLDVFTKNVNGSKPVIVWLNGGYSEPIKQRFTYKSLVAADLVVVVVNYRLSIFGFLCLGIEKAPGNIGLKDVIQALKWVRDDISNFGGDPKNVILLGHGSGAAMVDLITVSPLSDGLVHAAIALSGSGLAPWAVAFDPLGYAKAFGAAVDFTGNTTQELANHLKNTDVKVLAAASRDFVFTNNSYLFAPCIENTTLKNSLLNDAPINLLRKNSKEMPYMSIYVTLEGSIRVDEAVNGGWLEKMQENFADFLPMDIRFDNEIEKNETVEKIRRFYFGNNEINKDTIREYLKYEGDTLTTVPVMNGVKERAAVFKNSKNSKVYLMRFNFLDSNGIYTLYGQKGVRHGYILNYILDGESVSNNPKKRLIQRFAAFAYNRYPSIDGKITYWPSVQPGLLICHDHSNDEGSELLNEFNRKDPEKDILLLWDSFKRKSPESLWLANMYIDGRLVTEKDGLGAGYITLIVICVLGCVGAGAWVVKGKHYTKLRTKS